MTTNPAEAGALGCIGAINAFLDSTTAGLDLPPNLKEAVRYALLGGGKRMRPILAWHCCIAAGGHGEESLPAGAAIELIHAFSLVHDDLPALDNDDLRRGIPTLHVHAGEAMAILAGDAMMSLAFEVLARGGPDRLAGRLGYELSRATTAMIAGQVYDTLGGFDPGLGPRDRLELIHRNKTGALIRAACRMGAMSARGGRGADEGSDALAAVSRYADAIGLMFQIVDDLLDVETTAEQTGKRTRKDAEAGKLTYPGLIGVDASRREVERLEGVAMQAVDILGPDAKALRELCHMLAVRRS